MQGAGSESSAGNQAPGMAWDESGPSAHVEDVKGFGRDCRMRLRSPRWLPPRIPSRLD